MMKSIIFWKRALIFIVVFFISDFLISVLLSKGLNMYYGFSGKPQILINGSSMTISGFNRNAIEKNTGKRNSIYAHEGVSVFDRYEMINYFYHLYPTGIETVVYEINPILFSDMKSAENVYTIFYPFMDYSMLDKYIRSNAGTVDYYINKFIRTKRFESRLMRLIISGYIGKSENLKTNSLDTVSMNNLFHQKGSVEVKMEKGNIQAFENTMNLIKSHKSKILLVMMPMYKIKYQTFNRTGYEALCNYLREYCRTIGGAEFIDLNYASLTNRPDLFSDFLHFNVRGQTELTDIISTILMTKDIDQRSH